MPMGPYNSVEVEEGNPRIKKACGFRWNTKEHRYKGVERSRSYFIREDFLKRFDMFWSTFF